MLFRWDDINSFCVHKKRSECQYQTDVLSTIQPCPISRSLLLLVFFLLSSFKVLKCSAGMIVVDCCCLHSVIQTMISSALFICLQLSTKWTNSTVESTQLRSIKTMAHKTLDIVDCRRTNCGQRARTTFSFILWLSVLQKQFQIDGCFNFILFYLHNLNGRLRQIELFYLNIHNCPPMACRVADCMHNCKAIKIE